VLIGLVGLILATHTLWSVALVATAVGFWTIWYGIGLLVCSAEGQMDFFWENLSLGLYKEDQRV
jgi:hypothetical protein